jgi:hypothetical protein
LVTSEEVGLAWCRYATRATGVEGNLAWEADPDGWAAELAQESAFLADKEFVRRFLIVIADAAPDDVLGWIGAGPLREFLSEYPDQRAWAEAQAASSERFGHALAHS